MRSRLSAALLFGLAGLGGSPGCGSGLLDNPPEGSPSGQGPAIDRQLAFGATGSDVRALNQYLAQFGYFPNDDLRRRYPQWRPAVAEMPSRLDTFDSSTQEALRAFQRNLGLSETGIFD